MDKKTIEECFVFEAWVLYGVNLTSLDEFLHSGPMLDADRAIALQDRERALRIYDAGNLGHAMEIIRILLLVKQTVEGLVPLAEFGKRFRNGRKTGSVGKIRKVIALFLEKNPAAKPAQMWEALRTKPPARWAVHENSTGKYIEGPHARDSMGYARFCNVFSEERKKVSRR